jgi:hypothetical protein
VARSVPEKTLEHWSSQYVAYRYRSKAALWWPASGADVEFEQLPKRPGKIIQIELKTTEVVGRGIHEVEVDLGQLWEYCRRPVGHQPFYAFPRPHADWHGDLRVAVQPDLSVTDLGYSRSGKWWFANWMVVLTTQQVAGVLAEPLAAHGSRRRGVRARLVHFASGSDPLWGAGAEWRDPGAVRWLDFWTMIDSCGRPEWPQVIRLPLRLTGRLRDLDYREITTLLMAAGRESQDAGEEDLVRFEPSQGGEYWFPEFPDSQIARRRLADEGDSGGFGHRLGVAIDAQVLSESREEEMDDDGARGGRPAHLQGGISPGRRGQRRR